MRLCCQLAAATSTHPQQWFDTDPDVIMTMLDVLDG